MMSFFIRSYDMNDAVKQFIEKHEISKHQYETYKDALAACVLPTVQCHPLDSGTVFVEVTCPSYDDVYTRVQSLTMQLLCHRFSNVQSFTYDEDEDS